MSYKRQHPGKRERAARNRHRRVRGCYYDGSKWVSYKLGREHFSRRLIPIMCVADMKPKAGSTNGKGVPTATD